MAEEIILPVLGMAQDTGKIVQWLKSEGSSIQKGEPIVEIETDKITVELEATTDGLLAILTPAGEEVPVNQVIGRILTPAEHALWVSRFPASAIVDKSELTVSPLAARMAAEHRLDLSEIRPVGKRIQKADIMAHLQQRQQSSMQTALAIPASPKARRLARERGASLEGLQGSGPEGAILAADVLAVSVPESAPVRELRDLPRNESESVGALHTPEFAPAGSFHSLAGNGSQDVPESAPVREPRDLPRNESESVGALHTPEFAPAGSFHSLAGNGPEFVTDAVVSQGSASSDGSAAQTLSSAWQIMAERTTQSWTQVPHFFLLREINVSNLIAWRTRLLARLPERVTYSDLLIRIVATALQRHPQINASWRTSSIVRQREINIGLAVASERGLIVPVLHHADQLTISGIARERQELVTRAQVGKLKPQDLQEGTFTISNLGMYGVDAFSAIINAPQAAILAVGRIAERVVPVGGQAAVRPMMTLSLSCDHRVIDGMRGAQFLETLAGLAEEPLDLLS